MTGAPPFVHLHNHSDLSLLDGALRVEDLVRRAVEEGMPAVALTDHGNMFAAIRFYEEGLRAGVKPIIGSEMYLTLGSRFDRKSARAGGDRTYHMVLLAENEIGFRNLIKLSTASYLEGFYYKPRIDMELLRERSEGLIALTACMRGPVTVPVIAGDMERAEERARMLLDIFGPDRLFLEVQNHGIEEERIALEGLRKLGRKMGLGLVATNDCHYLTPDHADSHDILLCIGTGKDLNDPNRLRYTTSRNHFASAEEMARLFPDDPEALANTVRIADRIDLAIDLETPHLPEAPIPEGFADADAYLAHLVREAIPKRYPGADGGIEERVTYELDVIRKVGYAGYFIIVRDFIRAARERGIPVGPGRGSAAGSIVAYLLRITDVDPMRFSLLFERFLNPERVSFPDIDIDFCYNRRGEVIEYVIEKYGERSVAQIITFGTMAARAVIRDVGRVLQVPYAEVDKIAKQVPADVGMTLARAEERVPELKEIADGEGSYADLWRHARNLEGFARHASTHAAGVLIAPGDITDYVPLYRASTGDTTTQWDMKACEKVGLLKMDFLGLRTLTVLHDAVALIRETSGVDVDLSALPLDDPDTFRLLSAGETVGVFQLESSGMRDLLVRLQPGGFDDIIAVNALFRPGPLGSGMVEDFIERRHGRKKIRYLDPCLEPILKDTYGVILYQEQVMQIANCMGGFTYGEADILRRAMGKKKKEEMAEQRAVFVDRAVGKGFARAKAEKMFDLMAFFAGYGFNKSHSTAYALLSYHTAWLKAHYPREFLAATLTSEMSDTDRVVTLIGELNRLGIPLLPPDVNHSGAVFTCEGEGVRFGLAAVKNVGRSAVESVLLAREEHGPFHSLFHLCEQLDLHLFNKRTLESLIQAGALDRFSPNRAALLAAAETALERANRIRVDRDRGQTLLFDGAGDGAAIPEPPLPDAPPWARRDTLEREKAVLGFYVSGHPLADFADELRFTNTDSAGLERLADGDRVALAGMVLGSRRILDRKGEPMAFVQVEDFKGTTEVVLFSRAFKPAEPLLGEGEPLLFRGTISARRDEAPKLLVEDVTRLAEARVRFARLLRIRAPLDRLGEDSLAEMRSLFEAHPGPCPVQILVDTGEGDVEIRSRRFRVEPAKELVERLRRTVGKEAVQLVGDAAG
ncbi:MAG: DNA polymerase III subunit alpha [Candidatus Eisenbacteria bacterium]|nr:DNA polymerase III subunit alpha [Candidatus Eisenbacteria bacterium]